MSFRGDWRVLAGDNARGSKFRLGQGNTTARDLSHIAVRVKLTVIGV